MSAKLDVFKAELEALEAADGYDAPQYDWLVEQVERLEREEKAKAPAPAPAPTTATADDPVRALQADMEAAVAHPERFTDAQISNLVSRYNHAVAETGRTGERVDAGPLARDMLAANANPEGLSDAEHSALVARYNQAIVQGPEKRTSEALRGELASGDLATRMRAAAELAERGELDDATAAEVVAAYNFEVDAAGERGPDVAALPPEIQEAAKVLYAAEAAMNRPPDPIDAAIGDLNAYVRGMKPPSLEDQLEALGVQAEPEQEQVPEPASQEA